MMFAADTIATPAFYQKVADELETIAETVRHNPKFPAEDSERLDDLAKTIRRGADRIRNIVRN